jgi:hypothetical protein
MFPSSPWIAAQIARHVYLERTTDTDAHRLARTLRADAHPRRPVDGPPAARTGARRRLWVRTPRARVV